MKRYRPDTTVMGEEAITEDNFGEYVKYSEVAIKIGESIIFVEQANQAVLAASETIQKLVAENARMREAIEFATAPDMWQEQHDGMLDYRYVDWYVDVLNAALEPKSTDAAIAELRAQGVDELIADRKSDWMVSYCEDAADFAANLRAGRKG